MASFPAYDNGTPNMQHHKQKNSRTRDRIDHRRACRDRDSLTWFDQPRPGDAERVRALTAATDVFSADECDIAAGIIDEHVRVGPGSGYAFALVERDAQLVGFGCWGPIPGTQQRFDLYWLAVDSALRGQGLGRRLLERAEASAAASGGAWMFVDTSSLDGYAPAWRLYEATGYRLVARIPEFFAAGDAKLVFAKPLS